MWKEFLSKFRKDDKIAIVEEQPKPKWKREPRNFKHFPLNETKTGWIVTESDKIFIMQLEQCLDLNMSGGFNTTELALAVLEHLTDTKWTPPKITIEKIEPVKSE